MAIKAIQTNYKGYHFRSRLEARWAVFFDALGLQWEYEPEGFDLGDDGWYLPDFRVTSPQGYVSWYEVKPKASKEDEKLKALRTLYEKPLDGLLTSTTFTLLSGDPFDQLGVDPFKEVCPRCLQCGDPAKLYGSDLNDWTGEYSYGCGPCDHGTAFGVSDIEYNELSGTEVRPCDGWVIVTEAHRHKRLIDYACTAARSARFEHGETPK